MQNGVLPEWIPQTGFFNQIHFTIEKHFKLMFHPSQIKQAVTTPRIKTD